MISDRKGNMPFAAIAVSILLVSTVMIGITGEYSRSESASNEMTDVISGFDESVEKMRNHIEKGLGEIILCISTADGMGGMDSRVSAFRDKAEKWLEYNSPLTANGISAKITDNDLNLTVARTGNGYSADGSVPSYLKAEGTVTLEFREKFVKTTKEIEITSDGTCGLPLTLERTSMFESMADGKISLSNMITYQLEALAQYRVINGYGIGNIDTSKILTRTDVEKAYSYALDAMKLICFRSDGTVFDEMDSVDMAGFFIGDTDTMEIDLSSIYAQTLYSQMDSVVMKWFEYLCGDKILHVLSPEKDYYKRLCDVIGSFIKGESVSGAESYIEDIMSSHGYSKEDYSNPGKGTTEVIVSGITVSIDNPTVNLMDRTWIKYFKSDYYESKDSIKDFMRGAIRLACAEMASEKSLGKVSVSMTGYGESDFSEKLGIALEKALDNTSSILAECLESSVDLTSASDPFYTAIANAIYSHQNEFVLEDEFLDRISHEIELATDGEISFEEARQSDYVSAALQEYRSSVIEDLSVFGILMEVPGGEPGLMKKIAAWMLKQTESLMDIMQPVRDGMRNICEEWCSRISVNPASGFTELPDCGPFVFTDGNTTSYEYLDAKILSNPVSTNPTINSEKSVHSVGFSSNSVAAYTTVFTATIHDRITYEVKGGNSVALSSGNYSSRCSGTANINLTIEVPVISGWALDNVDYRPSTTIIDDSVRIILDILEPIIEPLMDIMSVAGDVLEFLAEKLTVVSEYVAKAVTDMYEKVMEPIQKLNEWISTEAANVFSDATLDLFFSIGLGKQYIDIGLFGYNLRISTSAMTWVSNTKTLFTATLSGPVAGLFVSAGITVKVKGDVKSDNLIFTGNGSISSDDWKIKMSLDPLMKSSKHLLTIDGSIGDTDVSLVLPELVNYYETGLSLSDIPGLGDRLSSIPVPGLGVNIGLDAGFTLRYSHPVQEGLLINEFESNPPGDDRGNEWVELYNNSPHTIELDGYTLLACSDRKTKNMTLSGPISPGEYLVITPTFLLVNQSGKHTKNGESLVLKDPDGNEVDKTPTMRDTANDLQTIHRKFDGSTEWTFGKGSMGESNGSAVVSELITAADAKDIVWYGVQKAFEDVGSITDIDSLTEFIRSLVKNTVDRTIKHVSGRILEASVYVNVGVSDLTSSASGRLRLALRTDSDLASDTLKAIAGRVESLILGIKDPYRIQPDRIIPEDVDIEMCLGMEVGFPKLLCKTSDIPRICGDVVFRANLASLTRIIGIDTGKPSIDCGIRFDDVPTEAIPSIMKPNKKMSHDIWLFRLTVSYG